MKYWKITLSAAVVALAIPPALKMQHALDEEPVKVIGGWNVIGAIDGRDTITPVNPPTQGELPSLWVEKKSPFKSGHFLQVFKTFDGTALRGTKIHMTYEIQVVYKSYSREFDSAIVRMQCGNHVWTNEDSEHLTWITREVSMNIPSDATKCSFGISLVTPGSINMRSIKFDQEPIPYFPGTPQYSPFPINKAAAAPSNLGVKK